MSTFGILLKNYRERAGLSQNELAVQAGLSASTISRVEGGTRNPLGKRRQILALAKALSLQQSEIDALLSAADLAPSTAPELSLHPRDETLYRIAQELESLRNDRQIAPAQVRFIEETLLLVLRGARAALPAVDLSVVPSRPRPERGRAVPGRPAGGLHRQPLAPAHDALHRARRRGAQPALGAQAAPGRSAACPARRGH